MYMSVIVL